jgi:hypothetical protein
MVLVFDEALFVLSVDQNHLERRFGEYLIEYCFFFFVLDRILPLFIPTSSFICNLVYRCMLPSFNIIFLSFPLEKNLSVNFIFFEVTFFKSSTSYAQ